MTPTVRGPRQLVKLVGSALSIVLLAAAALVAFSATSTSVAGAATSSSSAVTKAGSGRFSDLEVTVGQTKNLTNQVVSITWTGAKPTLPAGGTFSINYVQLMQCWGDDAAGPTREQCVYGATYGVDSRGGFYTNSRQLNYGTLVDPQEPAFPNLPPTYVPFRTVTGETVNDRNGNEFFDANSTNEVAYAATNEDGTGQAFFEMATNREAPALGCGVVVKGAPRACWLVAVPRDDREVDGTKRDQTSTGQLLSSPLSRSNWDQRIVFPMQFAPIDNVCPIGARERRLVGSEEGADAVTRWQPVLCADGGSVFGFSQVADGVARRQLSSTEPGMAVLTEPLRGDDVPQGQRVVYAPIAVSAIAVGFLVEGRYNQSTATPAELASSGRRIESMKLNQRLLAKLLTQTYLADDQNAPYLKDNPVNLFADKEFLALNPQYAHVNNSLSALLVPLGLSDLNGLVWDWILSDQSARDFLAGTPDEHGTRVNPFYQGTAKARDDFPKASPFCQPFPDGPGPLCTFDAYPFVTDLHEGSRSSSRGDTNARTAYDPSAPVKLWKKAGVQGAGSRAIIAITDSVAAARFGLNLASLRNAAGAYTQPTESGMRAGLTAMRKDPATGFLEPDLSNRSSTAYPLMAVSYATTVPKRLTAQEALDYATFVRFAARKGQVIGSDAGQLPPGYVPLTPALVTQATQAATLIEKRVGVTPTSPPSDGGSSSGGGSGGGNGTSGGGGGGSGTVPTPTVDVTTPAATVPATPSAMPSTTSIDVAPAALATPTAPVPPSRFALALALLVGALATASATVGLLVASRAIP